MCLRNCCNLIYIRAEDVLGSVELAAFREFGKDTSNLSNANANRQQTGRYYRFKLGVKHNTTLG